MTRTHAPSHTTLHLMQASRRYDKVTPFPQRPAGKPSPKRNADILPFTCFRAR